MGSLKNSVLAFLVLVLIFFTGCGNAEKKHEDVIKHIRSIKSYSCKADINIINDKQKLKYECKLYHDEKRGSRIDIAGKRKLIFKDDSVYVTDKVTGKKYIQERTFDEVYHLAFINDYINLLYQNEKVKYSQKEVDGVKYELISFDTNSNNKNIQSATLYLSSSDLNPTKLVIYDYSGTEKIAIVYHNFVANKKLNSSLFKFNI